MESSTDQTRKKSSTTCYQASIHFLQGVALTLFMIGLFFTISLTILFRFRLKPLMNYGIVFDAGSSHTEMLIYQWAADKSNGLGNTSSVDEYFVCRLNSIYISDPEKSGAQIKLKGISDFDQYLQHLDSYFRSCLNQAIEKIPVDRQKFSPIFLGATAGMRLAQLKNETRASLILETIREIFANTPFQFVVARQVRILSGMEEAISGWITTNLLMEKFQHRRHKKSPQFDSNMVGVLDLGGASTQVTFTHPLKIIDQTIENPFTTNITLFNQIYEPYAKSHLCWGKDEALKRHRVILMNRQMKRNTICHNSSDHLCIRDPCFSRGFHEKFTIKDVFQSPCTWKEKDNFKTLPNISSVIFSGSGNSSLCKIRLEALFNKKSNDSSSKCGDNNDFCAFNNNFQPVIPKNLDFIGLSGYYHVFNNLAYRMSIPGLKLAKRYHLKDFNENDISRRRQDVCETNSTILYHQEGMTRENEQYKRRLCFDAWYVYLLLTYGIGFQSDDLRRLTFADSLPTGKVGWALGYMINQTNYIPAEYRERILSKSSFIGWLSGSLVIVFITVVFLFLTCFTCYKQYRQSSQEKSKHTYRSSSAHHNV